MIAINRNEAPYLHHIEGNHKVMNLGRQRFDSARFSADGNKIVGVSPDGIVRVLDGTPWEE
jgi:hypothetical protein